VRHQAADLHEDEEHARALPGAFGKLSQTILGGAAQEVGLRGSEVRHVDAAG